MSLLQPPVYVTASPSTPFAAAPMQIARFHTAFQRAAAWLTDEGKLFPAGCDSQYIDGLVLADVNPQWMGTYNLIATAVLTV
jgi:hypothetical protein